MKNIIPLVTFLSGGALLNAQVAKAAEIGKNKNDSQKPNIIYIISDDQKWNTIHALGNDEIITPNLDKLAENAMIYRNAYCFGGNGPGVSVPSRNQLITGRIWFDFERDNEERRRKDPNYNLPDYMAPTQWENLPKTFNRAGYETFYREKMGKYNLHDIRKEFKYYDDIHMVTQLKTGRAARTIVDDAIHYLDKDRDREKPFLMYLGLPCPHDPRWSHQAFYDLYDDDDISLPKNYLPNHHWDIGAFTRDEKLEQYPRTKKAIKKHLHDYYALISAMDYDLGRLFAYLEKEDLFKNTIIVFTSDQGIAIGDHGLMGKQSVYEGVMKVPLFITGPGIKKGESDAFVYLHDIYPTLCELANIDAPADIDGISFKENLMKGKKGNRDRIIMAYRREERDQRSIRIGDWKLMWFPEIDKFNLFNLKKDPDEIHNLAYKKKYEQKVQWLLGELKKELEKAGETRTLEFDPTVNPVFEWWNKKFPKDTTGGIAPGPNIANPPVVHTTGWPYFYGKKK